MIESLFLLDETKQQEYQTLVEYEIFFYMLRPDYLENTVAHAIVHDFWVYYFYEETPIINDQLAMVYLLRKSLLDEVMRQEKLRRIKAQVKNSYEKALIAAIFTLNLYTDWLDEKVFPIISKETRKFLHMYSAHSRLLFTSTNDYPKQYVLYETEVLQALRQSLKDNAEEYLDVLINFTRFIDSYLIVEQKLFKI